MLHTGGPAGAGTNRFARQLATAAVLFAGTALTTGPANATNGYFANGYGAPSKAMAGAGVAEGEGPLAAAQNPALGVDVGNVAGVCFTGFMPKRSVTNSAGGGLAQGEFESENEFFPIVCGGANYMVRDDTSVGLLLFGNGGMNTEYTTAIFDGLNPGRTGTTPLGVDLAQAFIALNVSHKVTDTLRVGAAPVLALQQFKAYGLEDFIDSSTDGTKLTGNGYDKSHGGGFKLGAAWDAANWLTFGLSYQSRMWMTKFDKYSGLFAEQGDFDIPPYVSEGVAIRPMKGLTVQLEHQRIFYDQVKSVSNSNSITTFNLGADNGAGFGWDDMDIFRLGLEYDATPALTLRTGYSHATDFAKGKEVLFNVLAPATINDHIGAGFTYRFNPTWSMTGSAVHAFKSTLTGNNTGMTPNQTTELEMSQNEFSLGFSYHW